MTAAGRTNSDREGLPPGARPNAAPAARTAVGTRPLRRAPSSARAAVTKARGNTRRHAAPTKAPPRTCRGPGADFDSQELHSVVGANLDCAAVVGHRCGRCGRGSGRRAAGDGCLRSAAGSQRRPQQQGSEECVWSHDGPSVAARCRAIVVLDQGPRRKPRALYLRGPQGRRCGGDRQIAVAQRRRGRRPAIMDACGGHEHRCCRRNCRTRLLGVREVLPGRRPRLRQRHDPHHASLRALRRRLADLVIARSAQSGPASDQPVAAPAADATDADERAGEL